MSIKYDSSIEGLYKQIAEQQRGGRYCPFACRGEGKYICVGRCGSDFVKVLVVDDSGIGHDVSPLKVDHLLDCPVVRGIQFRVAI